jgi:hypothetical protein
VGGRRHGASLDFSSLNWRQNGSGACTVNALHHFTGCYMVTRKSVDKAGMDFLIISVYHY